MILNQHILKMPSQYLFRMISEKVRAYEGEHPGKKVISLGIGDVTKPLIPAVVEGLHRGVEEMAKEETFRGYGPCEGYDFLREVIAKEDYRKKGIAISPDEIFVSDGAKSDTAGIQELFQKECVAAVCDPSYPVYIDSNAMAGRGGVYQGKNGTWSKLIYMPCREENDFQPEFPEGVPQMIYLCSPNNPTGAAMKKEELQKWVDYANEVRAVLLFDGAYEAFITEEGVPHSIYECEGARKCAIEFRSFSKKAGFTGLRLGFTVIPKDLVRDGAKLHSMWKRRQSTKYNGASYVVQKGAEAVYTEEGKKQIAEQIRYYQRNGETMKLALEEMGYEVYGGVNAPYLWMKVPKGMTSWRFFDRMLKLANVVIAPGVGFGPRGEGYVRLTAFGKAEETAEAIERIRKITF